ncbi:MAG TPA: hypothetical protein PLU23_01575 [Anaerolineaceae bacterium]|nr:hypothetical protein [Anaerolineaceae bacterium]
MDAFIELDYYQSAYGGSSIASIDFDFVARRASYEVNSLTFDRAEAIINSGTNTHLIDRIKMATCAVAEELNRNAARVSATLGIDSESVGDHSVKYTSVGQLREHESLEVYAIVEQYLGLTGLMYRGVA